MKSNIKNIPGVFCSLNFILSTDLEEVQEVCWP